MTEECVEHARCTITNGEECAGLGLEVERRKLTDNRTKAIPKLQLAVAGMAATFAIQSVVILGCFIYVRDIQNRAVNRDLLIAEKLEGLTTTVNEVSGSLARHGGEYTSILYQISSFNKTVSSIDAKLGKILEVRIAELHMKKGIPR